MQRPCGKREGGMLQGIKGKMKEAREWRRGEMEWQ